MLFLYFEIPWLTLSKALVICIIDLISMGNEENITFGPRFIILGIRKMVAKYITKDVPMMLLVLMSNESKFFVKVCLSLTIYGGGKMTVLYIVTQ